MRGRRQYSMELVRLTNIKSQQVQEYSDIEDEAKELIVFMDENNGQFAGDHDTAYALAHCQVNQDKPYKFFVVSEKCIEDKMFKHRVIINPEIIDMRKEYKRVFEGCMSFPYRKAKKIERFMFITVKYEVPNIWGKLKTIERELQWPASQIFQHELDHLHGKNIFNK